MRFVVAQRGARRGYAVAVALQKAGLLERFYTDLAGNFGAGRWLLKLGRLLGRRSAADNLAGRCIPDLIRAKTVSFWGPDLWFRTGLGSRSANGANSFRQQLRCSRALGRAMVNHGFGQATHLYSMLGECGPLHSAAKSVGLTTVTEFYILPSAERIVAREQDAFPDWEPPLPDLDAVRREFPEQQQLIANTDFAICPSEAVRTDLDHNFGFARTRSAVVPYGAEANAPDVASRHVPGRVLFVGTAGLRKGIQYLALAAGKLHRRGRAYEVRVAGDVSASVARHLSCRHLRFLGRVPRSAVPAEFDAADVFVLPSLAEGSAEAAYEALAAGLPVITTPAAGSVVRDGVDGFIVPERDPTALANAIERVIENRSLRNELASNARARAREYNLQRYGERLVNALRSFEP